MSVRRTSAIIRRNVSTQDWVGRDPHASAETPLTDMGTYTLESVIQNSDFAKANTSNGTCGAKVRVRERKGCLLYTSPSPRDRG
eukprot:508796-Rhodomonas_salina.1